MNTQQRALRGALGGWLGVNLVLLLVAAFNGAVPNSVAAITEFLLLPTAYLFGAIPGLLISLWAKRIARPFLVGLGSGAGISLVLAVLARILPQ
jgi:hypothetical protein